MVVQFLSLFYNCGVQKGMGGVNVKKVKKVTTSVLINIVESCPSHRAKPSDVAAL